MLRRKRRLSRALRRPAPLVVGARAAGARADEARSPTPPYDLFRPETDVRDVLTGGGRSRRRPRGYVSEWFVPQAGAELLHFRSLVDEYEHADVLRVVLARAARSARLTAHFDLDSPRAPRREPYWSQAP